MNAYRASSGRALHLARTAVDAKLMERSGLDEVNLRRVRRAFTQRWGALSVSTKRELAEGAIRLRYQFVTEILRATWTPETWECWLRYLEHTERDIHEMQSGEYPISPYIVRLFSALLGIKVDFLLLGTWPCSDQRGANIDAHPATGTRA